MSLYHCYYGSLRKPHSEKLYPQFLHPFRQRFYLQSTGFTNRVAYRFFPFPFPTVFLRPRTISYLASISNYYKSILYYYLALRVKYIGWKMVLYESNDYHNFPTLWGRTNPLRIRVSYKVKKKNFSTYLFHRGSSPTYVRISSREHKDQKGNRSDRKPFEYLSKRAELEKSDTTGFGSPPYSPGHGDRKISNRRGDARWPQSTTIVPFSPSSPRFPRLY